MGPSVLRDTEFWAPVSTIKLIGLSSTLRITVSSGITVASGRGRLNPTPLILVLVMLIEDFSATISPLGGTLWPSAPLSCDMFIGSFLTRAFSNYLSLFLPLHLSPNCSHSALFSSAVAASGTLARCWLLLLS